MEIRRGMISFSVLVLAATGLGVGVARPAGAAAGLPPGFADVPVASVPSPTSLTPLADGRVLATSQTGQIATIDPANGAVTALSVPGLTACTNSERGVLGAAQNPASPSQVFVYYTANLGGGACANRVARFTLSGNSLNGLTPILDNIPSQAGNHNGGDIHFGKDGALYVAVGDSGCNPRSPTQCAGANRAAQDLSLLNGKILRVDANGDPAPGNPFLAVAQAVSCKTGPAAPGQVCREIFAYGLRNPFRIAPDPNAPATRFFVNDVGQDTAEEVDDLVAGANYGWPCREGPVAGTASGCPLQGPVKEPFYAYGRSEGCVTITGGAFVPDGAWPGYDGTYLFGDFGCDRITTLTATCTPGWKPSTLASSAGPVVELEFVGRDLWYATIAGAVRRIVPPAPPGLQGIGKFVPIAQARKLDTRIGLGGPAAPLPAGGTRTVSLANEVPKGAMAAVVNVTITEAGGPGFVTAWPAGQARPFTSVVNTTRAGQTVANSAIVALSPNAELSLYALTGGHLIVDVTGWFTPLASPTAVSDGRFIPVTPSRVVDSRIGLGAPAQRLNGQVQLDLRGKAGLPASGLGAVAVVVTGTDATQASYVTAWGGAARPPTSSVNLAGPGDTRANLVIMPTTGLLDLFANFPTHVVVDVVGWFTDGTAPPSQAGRYAALATPTRLFDSRVAGGPVRRLESMQACTVGASWLANPSLVSGLAVNATAVDSAGAAFLTVYPGATPWPGSSNLNTTRPGDIVAAQAVTGTTAGARLSFLANVPLDLVVDVSGFFTT